MGQYTREEWYKLHYPRWIYHETEDPKIVQNVYEHAGEFENGWSGPLLFYPGEVDDLRENIKKKEIELEQMKNKLSTFEAESRKKKQEERKGGK